MTTIRISVKNKRDANLLYRMLMKLSIVEKVEKIDPEEIRQISKQYSKLKMILTAQANPALFTKISDPTHWQKELRNEWE
jgi:DNA-directed RNA polymerase subunit F